MTAPSITSAPRSGAVLLAVLCASLMLAPAATASMITPPDRADGLGGAGATSHAAVVLPPDRADGLGGGPAAVHIAFTPPPDRVDGLGGSRFTSVSTPALASSGIMRTSSGFDWTAAAIGAIAGLGIALLAMAGWLARSRRHMALQS